ncbi:MAG: hypothetical protein V9F82_12435 [Dermatophilaceae bacterium]
MTKLTPDSIPDWITQPGQFIALEAPRMVVEMAATPLALPWLLRHRTTNGQPILVVPAMAPAVGTLEMRLALKALGHKVHCVPELTMLRRPRTILDVVLRETEKVAELYGEPITLAGWCYGGGFTRLAAHALPDAVRQVINMGVAKSLPMYPKLTHASGQTTSSDPLPVPSTSVYSRSDGTFSRKQVTQPREHHHHTEDIEVVSSHFGMANNPMTLHIIADRLMQPKGAWRPFSGWTLEQAGDKASAAGKVA